MLFLLCSGPCRWHRMFHTTTSIQMARWAETIVQPRQEKEEHNKRMWGEMIWWNETEKDTRWCSLECLTKHSSTQHVQARYGTHNTYVAILWWPILFAFPLKPCEDMTMTFGLLLSVYRCYYFWSWLCSWLQVDCYDEMCWKSIATMLKMTITMKRHVYGHVKYTWHHGLSTWTSNTFAQKIT